MDDHEPNDLLQSAPLRPLARRLRRRDDTTSSLDSKQIKDLTDAEAKELCESVAADAPLSKEAGCTLQGIFAAAVGEDCEATKQMCLSEPEDPSSTPDCSTATKPSTTCTATVGELTSCYSALKAQFDALTCASDISSIATTRGLSEGRAGVPRAISGKSPLSRRES